MTRAALIKLEALRRYLEAALFERRSKEYTGVSAAENLRQIRALEAQPLSLRAYLPNEEVVLQRPEQYGPILERTLRELKDIHEAVKNYNWSRR